MFIIILSLIYIFPINIRIIRTLTLLLDKRSVWLTYKSKVILKEASCWYNLLTPLTGSPPSCAWRFSFPFFPSFRTSPTNLRISCYQATVNQHIYILILTSAATSSSEYPDFITIPQNSTHSSSWIAPSLFLSTWSNNSFELSFGKFFDQNLSVSSLSIVLEPSVSIKLNKWRTFSLIGFGNYTRTCHIISMHSLRKVTLTWLFPPLFPILYLFMNVIYLLILTYI